VLEGVKFWEVEVFSNSQIEEDRLVGMESGKGVV
jgi:hypothetical protein